MEICRTIHDVRQAVAAKRQKGNRISFVPTMGALHDGHLSLMRLARKDAETVVVSIYVNPTQFGPNEDFDAYPRDLESDIQKCENEGVEIIFAPDHQDIYTEEKYLSIGIESLNSSMCGASRPGFFEGVLLIVNKLFNIVKPDSAVFGQKDIQQFQIISRMVEEFNHDITMIMGPIERANDGLALSSRNQYLNDEERQAAPGLYRTLRYIKDQILDGVSSPSLLIKHQKSELEAKGLKIDYLNVFSMQTLKPVKHVEKDDKYIVAGAVYAGSTRLIDNLLIEF
jgi:pantoate--beta-alanine ligase